MYDYLSLKIFGAKWILECEELIFKADLYTTTGEVNTYCQKAVYKCLTFRYYEDSETLYIKGSIHKFFNFKFNEIPNYNANRFTFSDFHIAVTNLKNTFNLDPYKIIVLSFEVGMNLFCLFDIDLFLRGLLFHYNKEFEFQDGYRECEHDRYIVKAYNKSIDNLNMLRMEIRHTRLKDIKAHIPFDFLQDLLNQDIAKRLIEDLIKEVSSIVYYDFTMRTDEMSKKKIEKTKDLCNYSNYWMNLDKKRRDRPKKMLKALNEKYSENNLIRVIEMMSQESIEILHTELCNMSSYI